MKKPLQIIKNQIETLQILFIEKIIYEIWDKNPNDYWIEISWKFIDFQNYTISFRDFESIARYNIPESIAYEYWDSNSMTFESDRIKEAKKYYNCDINLVMFYRYCMRDDKDFIEQEKNSLEESEKAVEKAKELFYKCFKNDNKI